MNGLIRIVGMGRKEEGGRRRRQSRTGQGRGGEGRGGDDDVEEEGDRLR